MTTSQVAVIMPALLLWLMLIVQYGLWFHAKQVAGAAVSEAVAVAQLPGGSAAAGEEAARAFLAQAGNLTGVVVEVERSADTVTATVTGNAPRLVPGFAWSVTTTAETAVERFIPEPER